MLETANLSKAQKIELIHILEEQKRRADSILYLTVYQSFYNWQKDFVKATSEYHECCLCAANQIGKTYLGTDIDAFHLLGEYPDDWEVERAKYKAADEKLIKIEKYFGMTRGTYRGF